VPRREFTFYLSPLCGWRAVQFVRSFAKAARVIAITDDSDCGHRLVGDGPSKILAAFLEQVL
jgi:hypothetical protein